MHTQRGGCGTVGPAAARGKSKAGSSSSSLAVGAQPASAGQRRPAAAPPALLAWQPLLAWAGPPIRARSSGPPALPPSPPRRPNLGPLPVWALVGSSAGCCADRLTSRAVLLSRRPPPALCLPRPMVGPFASQDKTLTVDRRERSFVNWRRLSSSRLVSPSLKPPAAAAAPAQETRAAAAKAPEAQAQAQRKGTALCPCRAAQEERRPPAAAVRPACHLRYGRSGQPLAAARARQDN